MRGAIKTHLPGPAGSSRFFSLLSLCLHLTYQVWIVTDLMWGSGLSLLSSPLRSWGNVLSFLPPFSPAIAHFTTALATPPACLCLVLCGGVFVYACVHMCMCVYMYMRMCVHMCVHGVHACKCVCIYVHIYSFLAYEPTLSVATRQELIPWEDCRMAPAKSQGKDFPCEHR